jgi:hypothetical protein
MDQKIKDNHKKKKLTVAGPYFRYLGTKEWTVIENSLKDLEDNQDIKITTVPEYVTGYVVKRLLDEGLIKGKKVSQNYGSKSRENM